jgi:phage tail-like protein
MSRREDAPFDPYGSFNFKVEIDDVIEAAFSEVTGLDSETDVVEYRNGTDDPTVRKLPGLHKQGNVTLKRGYTTSSGLFDWRKKVLDGEIERKDVTITLYDELGVSGSARVTFSLRQAWPSKYQGPELKASANEIAIETVEFCHEGITEIRFE